MATFPNIEPSFAVKKEQSPITKVVRFADGYESRVGCCIPNHQNPRRYILEWKNITEEEADTIDYFLQERAFDKASFDYAPPRESFTKTGTYQQSSTTITITISNHRLFAGDTLIVDFTSGTASDASFIVSSVTNENVFVITAASGATTSGNVTITKSGISKFICERWNKSINVPNLANINATFIEKFEP